MKNVELETVDYNTRELAHVSTYFVRCFSKYSGIFGTREWVESIGRLYEIIQNQLPTKMVLEAEGVRVVFSGFPKPTPKIEGETLVYQAREPRFVVEDRLNDLLPSGRTKVIRITGEILEEMVKVYGVKAEDGPPTLIFPKENYAKRVERTKALLLT